MATTKAACVGRPRGFDIDLALEQALEVFWRNGYEGTSLVDLTEAMGIKKPSLYAAFGNKEQLFVKAIELYENRPDSLFNTADKHEHIQDFIRTLILGSAAQMTDCKHPQGCALIKSILSCGDASEGVKEAMLVHKNRKHDFLLHRFTQAKEKGQLRDTCDPKVLSCLIITIFQGMSVHATEGATYEELMPVAEMAVECVVASCVK